MKVFNFKGLKESKDNIRRINDFVDQDKSGKTWFIPPDFKPEVVKPYMNGLDSWELNNHLIKKIDRRMDEYENARGAKLTKESRENIRKFLAKHMTSDIFSMYFNKNLEYKRETELNASKFKVLDRLNDSFIKILTKDSYLGSFIFSEKMTEYMTDVLMQLDETTLQDLGNNSENCQNQGGNGKQQPTSGKDGGVGQKTLDALNNAMDKNKDDFKKAQQEAQYKLEEYRKGDLDEQDLKEHEEETDTKPKNNASNGASKVGDMIRLVKNIEEIRSELSQFTINGQEMKKSIQKILQKCRNYFSTTDRIDFASILDTGEFGSIENLFYLDEIYDCTMIHEIVTSIKRREGKIDAYMDVSGSMNSSCGVRNRSGNAISKTLFSKGIVMELKRLQLLNEFYAFDTALKKIPNSRFGILAVRSGGGTTTDVALQRVQAIGRNALIITDAEDNISVYTPNAFFIGLEGSRFNSSFKDYVINGQCFIFDGVSVRKVHEC